MPAFSVDSDALITQAANIRATEDRIRLDLGTMHSQLMQLEGVWQGAASAGFQAVLQQWHAAQQGMQETLAAIGQALGVAGSQYAEAEQLSAGMFR